MVALCQESPHDNGKEPDVTFFFRHWRENSLYVASAGPQHPDFGRFRGLRMDRTCICSFTFVFEFVTDRTCRSLALALDCQHWTTVQKWEKCRQVKEAGTFVCLRASRNRNMFFCFPIYLPIEKAYSTKRKRYCCNSLSCKLLPQLIDNSAAKGFFFFFDRQLSYSCLSHSSSVLAANNCRVVLAFLHRSSSFSVASASGVQHENESRHARRVYLTNTYNLNSYDSRNRAGAESRKKTVPQCCSSIAFDFFRSFFIKSRAGEFSRSLRQPQQSPRLAPQCLAFP